MWDVILVAIILALICAGWVYWVFERERQQTAANFRNALRHELKSTGIESFDIYSFTQKTGVSAKIAMKEAADIYDQVYDRAIADGKITKKEKSKLDQFAKALAIPATTRHAIESRAKQEKYREETAVALADGRLTTEEAAELSELQSSLGLSRMDVMKASAATGPQAYRAYFRTILQSGRISGEDFKELSRLRGSLGLSEADAYELIRSDALNLYRQLFYEVKQDGRITPEEERSLALLQSHFKIPDHDIAHLRKQLARIKYIDKCRNGELPHVGTSKILEGGEICHYENECTYSWETTRSQKEVAGELVITNRRVIFTSMSKSFEFKPAKIVDIELFSDGISVWTSSRIGKGWYHVNDADLLEAILFAVTRKQKYLAAEGFSSNATRHIPSHVKQEVYARDGGKCVQCGATEYLEFDHIIPHSRGGANTVNNVQILCRQCNGLKSDRIG